MRNIIVFTTACACLMFFSGATTLSTQSNLHSFFDQADTFFGNNIKNGKVPYKAISQKPAPLNALVKQLGNASLRDATASQKKAFYIDAYNILVINTIIKKGIPDSPMDVQGFFDKIKHRVAGEQLTLDEIEKGRLLPVYNDPRIHFAVVCGAVSCPPLRPFAYQPEKLDEQLNRVTGETLNSDFIRVENAENTARLSEIFKWYKQDFLKKNDSVINFINGYRNEKIPADYTIDYYKYDWTLNSR